MKISVRANSYQKTKRHLKVQLVLVIFYEAHIFYLQFFIWRSTKNVI